MTVCAIKYCRNYKGRVKNTEHITYHQIPTNPIIRHQWIDRIRKSRGEATWKPSKTTVVCSAHFRSKDILSVDKAGRRRLSKEAVPSKALFLSSVQSSDSEDSDDIETVEKSNSNEAGPSGIHNDMCVSTQSSDNDLTINDNDQVPNNDTDQVPNNDQSDATINDKIVELQNKTELDEEDSFSDLDSVYDSPTEAKLRRDLRRKIVLERKHVLKIKSLRQQNLRLKRKIASFKQIIKTLKKRPPQIKIRLSE
ncbi:unnamed protein product [Chrysodeixis includens]|uniref:THAP-type domain-containing protein n=1 Tax=Chrysodeixis includens TaxID=689277 RepID=A0A9N8KWK5_CHRIL|nr:unnamed protein product [Chrysodeixis includens]